MPRFAIDHNGDIKSSRHNLVEAVNEEGQPEINHDVCLNHVTDLDHNPHHLLWGQLNGVYGETRPKEQLNKTAIKMDKSGHFFNECSGMAMPNKCNLSRSGMFCELDGEGEEEVLDEEEFGHEPATDFTNVFETHFVEPGGGGGGGHRSRGQKQSKRISSDDGGVSAKRCSRINMYHQQQSKGPPPPPPQPNQDTSKVFNHKCDQTVPNSKSKQIHRLQVPTDFYPSQCKYYFDSDTLQRAPGKPPTNESTNKVCSPKGESSSIWINSSKLVDKLHRKHMFKHASPMGPSGGINRHELNRGRHHREHHRHHHSSRHCTAFFDPSGPFAQLAMQGKLSSGLDDEHNFVVWNNDTNERLI